MSNRPNQLVQELERFLFNTKTVNIMILMMVAFISFGFYSDYKEFNSSVDNEVILSTTSSVIDNSVNSITTVSMDNQKSALVKNDLETGVMTVNLQKTFMREYIQRVNTNVNDNTADIMVDRILENSEKYDIPIWMIMSVMETESHFRPMVVSSANCIGAMQINPRVWKKKLRQEGLLPYGDVYTALTDPAINIDCGSYILNENLKMRGTNKGAILAYYGGNFEHYYKKVMRSAKKFNRHMDTQLVAYFSDTSPLASTAPSIISESRGG